VYESAANIKKCVLVWWAEEKTKLFFSLTQTLHIIASELGLLLPALDLRGSPPKLLK